MRCIVVAANQTRLDQLFRVLRDQQFDPVPSTEYGAGAALAEADISDVQIAVAVLPADAGVTGTPPPGLAAILVEIGILIGSGIPTLVLASRQATLPPALAGLPWLSVNLDANDDLDALRLHLRIFAKTAGKPGPSPSSKTVQPTRQPAFDLVEERQKLHDVLHTPGSELPFARFIVDLLSRLNYQVEGGIRTEDQGVVWTLT